MFTVGNGEGRVILKILNNKNEDEDSAYLPSYYEQTKLKKKVRNKAWFICQVILNRQNNKGKEKKRGGACSPSYFEQDK